MTHDRSLEPSHYLVTPGSTVSLADRSTDRPGDGYSKDDAEKQLERCIKHLSEAQERLWAAKERSLLIILQAMDAAGKDGAIKHVMRGINPQGCTVMSFGPPNEEERLHHFLWRPVRFLPERGRISIFNRSYYEEVLVVRVHPDWLEKQWISRERREGPLEEVWNARNRDINTFEAQLADNGVEVVKFFLQVSRKEQRKRLLARLDDPSKNWKFTESDVSERRHWDEYMHAYEQMLTATSTEKAPWYIIPADTKWFARTAIGEIIASRIDAMNLTFPEADPDLLLRFPEFREALEAD